MESSLSSSEMVAVKEEFVELEEECEDHLGGIHPHEEEYEEFEVFEEEEVESNQEQNPLMLKQPKQGKMTRKDNVLMSQVQYERKYVRNIGIFKTRKKCKECIKTQKQKYF